MRVELGVWQLDAAVLRREPQDGVELALADGALDQAIEKLAVLGSCALPQVAGGHVDDHVAREFGPLYQAFELVGLAAELGETGIKSGNAIGRTGFSQSRFSLAAAVAAGQTQRLECLFADRTNPRCWFHFAYRKNSLAYLRDPLIPECPHAIVCDNRCQVGPHREKAAA